MAKQVERFKDWGYRVNPDSKGYLNHTYIDFARWTDIHHAGTGSYLDIPINTFGVKDEHMNLLLIPRAYNNSPPYDPRPKSQKLALRDQIVSFWTQVEHRDVKDMRRIVYANVIEEALLGIVKDVYQMMDAPRNKDLLISRDDSPFDILLTQTPFGAGVQKMLDEYADLFANKRITSFYFRVASNTDIFDFIINLT